MALEARCACESPLGRGEVLVMLEADWLVLQGAVSARVSLRDITNVQYSAFGLSFVYAGQMMRLKMTPREAIEWAPRMRAQSPDIRDLLGLKAGRLVLVLGKPAPQVAAAIGNDVTKDAAKAALVLLSARDRPAVEEAAQVMAATGKKLPLWVLHGPDLDVNTITAALHGVGYSPRKGVELAPGLAGRKFAAGDKPAKANRAARQQDARTND